MYHKVRGVVLKSTKYSDSTVITTIYTDIFGRQSYFIRGLNKNKSKTKSGFLQVLSLVSLECTHKEHNLNTVREIGFYKPYKSIPFHQHTLFILGFNKPF